MFKNKSKIATVLLMFITVFLIGTIFYISTLLTSGDENKTSAVAPRKTKAANVTYSKLIALNQDTVEKEPEPSLTPTPTVLPEEEVATIETVSTTLTPSLKEDQGLTETPTPTETVLAYVNPTTADKASSEAKTVATLEPTNIKDLPDAGFIYNGLIIFAAAIVLVFFSFLF